MIDIEQKAHALAAVYVNQKLSDSNTVFGMGQIPNMIVWYESAYQQILEKLKETQGEA